MRFGVLGPLQAEADDGTPLALTRPSQRATLAVLLLHARAPLARLQLIDALWGDSPPGDADTALRVRIRDVRRALIVTNRILTRPAGYQIVVRAGEVDADVFGDLAARGRTALDIGNAEDAARLLEQACQLWRSPPLADLPDTPFARVVSAGLIAQRRDAQEWLLDARLALGQHHDSLSKIRAMIAADPLAEHPHVQLMLALYRSGQKVAALDAYSRLRELTTREFGQDPGPEARERLTQILADSPALQVRRTAMVTAAAPQAGCAPVRQLPAPPPDFSGRGAAIEALAGRVPGVGMAVTVLVGPPGIGTTALAVHAAHLAAGEFPDGQLFAALGGRREPRSPSDVLGEFLRALGVSPGRIPAAISERAAMYRSMLAGRRVLVLADGAAAASQVRPLLPGTRGSAVLVTSGSPLAALEGAHSIGLGPLSRTESIALLGKIVGEERLRADRTATTSIVGACAGLPLALRVAGARLAASPALSPADLAAALAGRDWLSELAIGDLSVRVRLAQAWAALEPAAQHALWLLAHARQVSSPTWLMKSVTGGAPGVVRELADTSLILQDPASGGYSLAPLVDRYARALATPWPGGAEHPLARAAVADYDESCCDHDFSVRAASGA
jgi:DNA-binding SARP family transcriptional activator